MLGSDAFHMQWKNIAALEHMHIFCSINDGSKQSGLFEILSML